MKMLGRVGFPLAMVLVVGLLAATSVPGRGQGREPFSAIYRLGDSSGSGTFTGFGAVYQRGNRVEWWIAGWGLPPGRHAHHIHGRGKCDTGKDVIFPFPDLVVDKDGRFFQEGTGTSNRNIAIVNTYWNIHKMSTAEGVGPGIKCGNAKPVGLLRKPGK